MSDAEKAQNTNKLRFMKILRAITDHADAVAGEFIEERPAVTHYMREQFNRIRDELARDDELLASLFPPVPDDTSIVDVAAIAQQLMDYADDGPSVGARAAKAAKDGLHITGESVNVMLSDLADLGAQIRVKVTEALDDAMNPGVPKTEEEIDARITELKAQMKDFSERIGGEDTPTPEDTAAFGKAAREMSLLQTRKTRMREKAACEDESEGDE